MLALRFSLVATGLFLIAGNCSGQTPLSDPADGTLIVEPVRIASPSDLMWTPPEPVHLEEIEGTWEITATDEMEPVGCDCGQRACPGVCRDPGHPRKPRWARPGDRSRGDCPPLRYRMADCQRAGNPHCVAPWAQSSVTSKYSAWFVGGGAAWFRGRCRKPSEGTWGLDYQGLFGHANVWLNYTRGRNQGGEGAYETDGEPALIARIHGKE